MIIILTSNHFLFIYLIVFYKNWYQIFHSIQRETEVHTSFPTAQLNALLTELQSLKDTITVEETTPPTPHPHPICLHIT